IRYPRGLLIQESWGTRKRHAKNGTPSPPLQYTHLHTNTRSAIHRTSPASETIAERPRNLAIGKNASRSSIHTHLLDTTSPESPAAEELTSGIAAECPASPEFLRTKKL
ncbi:hypothetical protein KGM_201403B, partial [Danaus plexippus plexippus]